MDNLQKLIDIEEIKNLKHRYFRAIDMADFDILDNVFSLDITIDYRGGTYRWESEGKETIKESLKHAFHNQTAAMHTAHQRYPTQDCTMPPPRVRGPLTYARPTDRLRPETAPRASCTLPVIVD